MCIRDSSSAVSSSYQNAVTAAQDFDNVYVVDSKNHGIALKRHPREKLFIATKLSNFSNYSRENSIAMYRNSFEDLQTDYIDYYLLHSIGNGGIEAFKARYIDNGMME